MTDDKSSINERLYRQFGGFIGHAKISLKKLKVLKNIKLILLPGNNTLNLIFFCVKGIFDIKILQG